MNGNASMTMLLNLNMSPDEEERLAPLDHDISNALIGAGITTRCGFTPRDEKGVRILTLVVWDRSKRVVMEIRSTEFMKISRRDLLNRLKERLSGSGPAT
jgi:hypothetical protein